MRAVQGTLRLQVVSLRQCEKESDKPLQHLLPQPCTEQVEASVLVCDSGDTSTHSAGGLPGISTIRGQGRNSIIEDLQ